MARKLFRPHGESLSVKFGEASYELLTDFLTNINKMNKEKLASLSKCCGNFKNKRLTEYVFLMTKELRLDPLVGYHAIELLQRFMLRHLPGLLTMPTPEGAAARPPWSLEEALADELQEKFPLVVFSCLQLSSKLSLHSRIIDNSAAVCFLHSVGHSVSKQTVLESELKVCKELDFSLNAPNPLTYVETLLEVLGHNEPSVPLERLHHLCQHVLQFISLQRSTIFHSLLAASTQCASPSTQQSLSAEDRKTEISWNREKFVTVTEDYMLLGVGVIAVASFTLSATEWKQILGELSHITGISRRSIADFAHVTLMHIVHFPASL